MAIMKKQQQQEVSEQKGLPVEVVSDSQHVNSVSEASVALNYYNAGTLTADAGEAAGTVVVAKLTQGGVLNALGDVIGTELDTSLAFTSTALTNEVKFPHLEAEKFHTNTGTLKADAITDGFSNGDYCVDYRTGTIYGVKASTQTALTSCTYKVSMQTAGGSTVVASSVSVSGGNDHDSAVVADGIQTLYEAKDPDGAAFPNDVAEGDAVRPAASLYGIQYVNITDPTGQGSAVQPENAGRGTIKYNVGMGAVVADFDGSAFPQLSDTEGKGTGVAASQQGVQYFFPTTEDGANTPMSEEDDAIATGQAAYLQGSKRKDFDGSSFSTEANTEGDLVIPAASAQGVGYVTLVSDDGSDYAQIKGYDSGTDSMKSFEVSPLSSHYSNEFLADETNATDGTYNYYIDMNGYRTLSIQGDTISGGSGTVTIKVYASNTGDVDAASADYVDVTNAWFGVGSFSADFWAEKDTHTPVRYVKVEVVASTGGSNDADWAITSYKQF